jgi:hypothetical protein
MTKLTFVAAALVAASAYATAASARSDVEARHTRVTKTSTVADCVRAPNVGAFASAPYSSPPCMPSTIN